MFYFGDFYYETAFFLSSIKSYFSFLLHFLIKPCATRLKQSPKQSISSILGFTALNICASPVIQPFIITAPSKPRPLALRIITIVSNLNIFQNVANSFTIRFCLMGATLYIVLVLKEFHAPTGCKQLLPLH